MVVDEVSETRVIASVYRVGVGHETWLLAMALALSHWGSAMLDVVILTRNR